MDEVCVEVIAERDAGNRSVLNAGQIEQVGSPLELYHHPANLFVAGFLGTPKMAFLDATVVVTNHQGVEIKLASGAHLLIPRDPGDLTPGDPITLGVRPEHLSLDPEGALPVTTDVTERLRSDTFCHVSAISGEALTVRVQGDCEVAYGERRRVGIDVSHCHLFDAQGKAMRALKLRAA